MKALPLKKLENLCKVDLIQQAGYQIEIEEFSTLFDDQDLYTLTAKREGVRFCLEQLLSVSEFDDGIEELYSVMAEQGDLRKDNEWYIDYARENWNKLSKVGEPVLTKVEANIPFKWHLSISGLEYLGITIVGVLSKALASLEQKFIEDQTPVVINNDTPINITWDKDTSIYINEDKHKLKVEGVDLILPRANKLLEIAEEDGKMILHVNGSPIPNLESCWLTPSEDGSLEVNITYVIKPKG